MHLSKQVGIVKHKDEHPFNAPFRERLSGLSKQNKNGFTLVELITIIVILGIISVAAIPRFFDRNVFDSRGFYDQVKASLRYAQKSAIAQRRSVCVIFGANSVALTIDSSIPRDGVCDTPLIRSSGGAYLVDNAQVAFDTVAPAVAPVNFSFNALGSPIPAAGQVITVAGYAVPITIEAGTGYVH